MRILHAAFQTEPRPTIGQQMRWEEEAAKDLGYEWRSVLWVGAEARNRDWSSSLVPRPIQHLIQWLLMRQSFYNWLRAEATRVDLVLLRYTTNDPLLTFTLLGLRTKVLLVHHNVSSHEISLLGGRGAPLKVCLERLLSPLNHALCAGVVSVTPEIDRALPRVVGIRRIPRCIYPNGASANIELAEDTRTDNPELLFVAGAFAPWHGLDLLADQAQELGDDFTVHVVGHVPDELREILEADSRFVLHGTLTTEEIRTLAAACHVGVSAMGLFRKGMRQACALKVREYLLLGLPAAGDYLEVFPSDFPYYFADVADLASLLSVARSCATFPRQAVRDASLPLVSKQVLVEQLATQLQTMVRPLADTQE